MQATQTARQALRIGTFVRIRADHPDHTRAGLDGMVIVAGDPCIGLMFGSDRYGRGQKALCVGIEAWEEAELDLSTAEH